MTTQRHPAPGTYEARQRIRPVLERFVPYSRLQLRRRPRLGLVTMTGRGLPLVLFDKGKWTLPGSSVTCFRIDGDRVFRQGDVRDVLPALVAVGLVTQRDRVLLEGWLCEEKKVRDRVEQFNRLRRTADLLGFKVIRKSVHR